MSFCLNLNGGTILPFGRLRRLPQQTGQQGGAAQARREYAEIARRYERTRTVAPLYRLDGRRDFAEAKRLTVAKQERRERDSVGNAKFFEKRVERLDGAGSVLVLFSVRRSRRFVRLLGRFLDGDRFGDFRRRLRRFDRQRKIVRVSFRAPQLRFVFDYFLSRDALRRDDAERDLLYSDAIRRVCPLAKAF